MVSPLRMRGCAVPATLTEIRKLGRTLKQRATDILAFFDRPGTSNDLASHCTSC